MTEQFRAGFGRRTINPPIGSEMPGGLQKNFHRERHDPLYTTAALFNDGRSPIMIVGANAFGIPRPIATWVKARIYDRLGVSDALVFADHGHNAGGTMDFMMGEADPAYQDHLAHQMIEASVAAYRHQRRSTLRSAQEPVPDGIFFNRRMRMQDGKTLTHPVRLKLAERSEIEAPDGPVDTMIRMIFVHDAQDSTRLLGTFVDVPCHNATRPGGYTRTSADYAGKLREMIPKRLGTPRSQVLNFSGACGDVTHVDNLGIQPERTGDEWADLIANAVTDAVQRGFAHATTIPHPHLKSRTQTIQLPRRDPDDLQLKRTQTFGDEDIWNHEQESYRELYMREPNITTEVQALGIGNEIGIAALPGEFFAEHGMQLEKSSPFPKTWVITQANDALGYAPPKRTHPYGYEWRTARSSQLTRTGGDELVKTVEKLLQEIHS